MNSISTQIPFGYFSAIACEENKPMPPIEDNLGEILTGDKMYKTPYRLKLKETRLCQVLCKMDTSSFKQKFLKFLIENNYKASFYLDGLPAAFMSMNDKDFDKGIPIGVKDEDGSLNFYNHFTFHIGIRQVRNNTKGSKFDLAQEEKYIISDFSIVPNSINHKAEGEEIETHCAKDIASFIMNNKQEKVRIDSNSTVVITYDVIFSERGKKGKNTKYMTRWDHYLKMKNDSIHWLSLGFSIVVVTITSSLVFYIFTNILKKEIDYINLVIHLM